MDFLFARIGAGCGLGSISLVWWSGRRSVPGFPLLRRTTQHLQNGVDRGSLVGILIPTKFRHFPQFVCIASGSGEGRSLRPRAFADTERCHKLLVLVKRGSARQNLGLYECLGLIFVEESSLRRWSSPSNICQISLWDDPSRILTSLDLAVPADTSL